MASSISSGSGGGDTASLLLGSWDQDERGPGLSNLFCELIIDVQSNEASSSCCRWLLPPNQISMFLDLPARRSSKRDACYQEPILTKRSQYLRLMLATVSLPRSIDNNNTVSDKQLQYNYVYTDKTYNARCMPLLLLRAVLHKKQYWVATITVTTLRLHQKHSLLNI
jgi:hypothetical protein